MRSAIFSAIAGASIRDGILRGVAVLTKGEAKGHGVYIDDKSLETYLLAAKNRQGGVPVKMDHGTGFYHIVGKLEDFRIDGETLRADLHLLKAHEQFPRIVEMAETMPESFGLSVSSTATEEKIDGQTFLRCDELHSVDLVDRPAANPTGLFSEPVDSQRKGMADKAESLYAQLKNWVGLSENAELSAANSKIVELTKKCEELEKLPQAHTLAMAEKQKEITELAAKLKESEDKQADFDKKVAEAGSKKALEIQASLGQPPIQTAPTSTPAAPAKTELRGLAKVKAVFAAQLKPTSTPV